MTKFVFSAQTKSVLTQMKPVDPWLLEIDFDTPSDQDIDRLLWHRSLFKGYEYFTHSNFILEELRTSALRDLSDYHSDKKAENEDEEEDTSVWGKIKLALIGLLGTVYNICNGFDASVSILNLFVGIPFWTIFLVGLIFSLLFVILFYSLDFVNISENLHVLISQSRQFLDFFQHQAVFTQKLIEKGKQQIEMQRSLWLQKLGSANYSDFDASYHVSSDLAESLEMSNQLILAKIPGELVEYEPIDYEQIEYWLHLTKKLITHQKELCHIRAWYTAQLDQYYVQLLKGGMTLLAGLLYFNAGFFVGQVFVTLVLSTFISATISLLSWPVMLISCSIGVAALLSVFWFSERLNIERLVGHWIGLDVDKIQQLPDDSLIRDNEDNLEKQNAELFSIKCIEGRFLSWEKRLSTQEPDNQSTDLSTDRCQFGMHMKF